MTTVREETFFLPERPRFRPEGPSNSRWRRRQRAILLRQGHALVDCSDIVSAFKQAMEDFWADEERSTCRSCGHRIGKPGPVMPERTD